MLRKSFFIFINGWLSKIWNPPKYKLLKHWHDATSRNFHAWHHVTSSSQNTGTLIKNYIVTFSYAGKVCRKYRWSFTCRLGFHPYCMYANKKDGKSKTPNVSDLNNFRQGILYLNYIWFFRIKEFIFKTIYKYAPSGSSELPITWVSGDPMTSSDVCVHLYGYGIYNLYRNPHRHT